MKLTEYAINRLTESRELRFKLAIALEFTEVWIDRLIKHNKANGPLTTVAALGVLREIGEMEQILENGSIAA